MYRPIQYQHRLRTIRVRRSPSVRRRWLELESLEGPSSLPLLIAGLPARGSDRPLAYGVEFLRLERGSGHFRPRTK
jgi:hypothetical protein